MRNRLSGCGLGALVLAGLLAGCNLAPDYRKPSMTTPVAYTGMGPWTPASPDDAAPRGDWWVVYDDPVLNGLEARIERSNPDLASALSRYDEAVQSANEAAAARYPELDLDASATQNKQSWNRPLRQHEGPDEYQDSEISGSFSYELDLWGRVRNLVAEGKANAQASAADAAVIRLSLETQLADAYFSLRGLDAQEKLLAETSADYAHALQLTEAQHEGGIVSGLDVGQAQTQYDSATAQLSDAIAQRAIYLHEIASLIGVPAPSFALAAAPVLPLPPTVPVAAPSDLLQRRPDIAEAERQAAAANAGIGVARARISSTKPASSGASSPRVARTVSSAVASVSFACPSRMAISAERACSRVSVEPSSASGLSSSFTRPISHYVNGQLRPQHQTPKSRTPQID